MNIFSRNIIRGRLVAAATMFLGCAFFCGAQEQTQTQKKTTAPQDVPSPSQQVVSELTKDNLDRVAASPAQLKAVLAKDTGLLVEV
jgi:hypothetical protein